MARTHYDVLGVTARATNDELRQAYRERARVLHPDRLRAAGRPETDALGDGMRELNEAWRVLRDPGRRRAYDRSLWPGPDPEPVVDVEDDDEAGPTVHDGAPLVRNLPWVVILAVLAAIFVFTALARSPQDPVEREVDITAGECVVVQPGVGASETSCTATGARQVVSTLRPGGQCPTGTERFDVPSLPQPLCLD